MDSDESADYIPRQCIPHWCRLCRFRIVKDDVVVVVVTEKEHTSQFCYSDSEDHLDERLNLRFGPCIGTCPHPEGQAAGCHWGCLSFAPLPPSLSLLKATEYSFEPCERAQREREILISRKLSRRLGYRYGILPPEIWFMVAEYLIRECAVVTIQESWLGRYSFSCRLDISKSISVRHVRIDDVPYIAHLSNTDDGCNACILRDRTANVHTVYVLEDHLGIRQILFDISKNSCGLSRFGPKPGMWWYTIPVTNGMLQTMSDGLKLRRVISSTESQLVQFTAWSTPMAQSDIRLLHFHNLSQRMADIPHDIRMASLKLNEPTVTGYSACWNGRIIGLHAHCEGDISFYHDYSTRYKNSVWIYACINSGESITELWQRKPMLSKRAAIMFRTNTGRNIIMGPHLPPWSPPAVWTQLSTLPKSPTRVYFNDSPRGICRLATSQLSTNQGPTSIAGTLSPYPKRTGVGDFFHSSANLRNAVTIRPCQETFASHSPIIGLLIQYYNGDRTCVGQVRFDCLRTELTVKSFPKLCLWFARTKSKHPYVAKVEQFPPSDSEPYEWLDLRWEGYLEWWFSHWQCQVYHDGKSSPPLV
ncbi:hypothetical protein F4823DRAFT_621082 [Ustulina deusta]|nr:hypothetical protein F4823DRAFT_621082 [Ustulina deusta]